MILLAFATASGSLAAAAEPMVTIAQDQPDLEMGSLAGMLKRTEATHRLMAEARTDLDTGRNLLALAPDLDEADRKLSLSLGGLGELRLADAEIMQLYDLQTRVDTEGSRLAGWVESLSALATRLDADMEALRGEADLWRRFRRLAGEREAPEPLAQRADTAVESLERLRGQALSMRNRLLLMLDRAAQLWSRVTDLRGEFQRHRELIHGQMRATSTDPLWRVEWDFESGKQHLDQVLDLLTLDLLAIQAYLREQWAGVSILFALPFLGISSMPRRWLERAAERHADEPTLRPTASVLSEPGWSGLLVALIAMDWLGPPGPVAYYDMLWLTMLLPGFFLARSTWGEETPTSVTALFLCLAPITLRTQLELMPLTDRWMQLVQALAMLVAVGRDYRAGRLRQVWPGFHRPVREVTAGLTLAVLCGALIANLFGFVGLGKILVQGILGTAGFALMYFLAGRVMLSVGLALLESPGLAYSRIVRYRREAVAGALRVGLIALFAGMWGLSALLIFRVQDTLLAASMRFVNHVFTVGQASISVRAVLTALLLLAGAYALARAMRLLLEVELFPRWKVQAGIPFAVSTLTRYAIGLFAVVLAVMELDIDLSRLGLLAGALGVGIGFGLQNIFNNFVSGLILLLEQPVNVGDVIQVDNVDGVVKRIGIRSSTVRTLQGAEIILPNAELISRDVINWTLSDRRRRLEIEVGVDYGSEPERVIGLLEAMAREAPEVLDNPEPFAILAAFGESAIEFRLYAWIEHYEDNLQIGSDLRRAILAGLRAAGIGIPFPQRDVHIRSLGGERV